MWVQFRLFLDVLSARIRTLRFKGGESDPARSHNHCPQVCHHCQSIRLDSYIPSRLPNHEFRYPSYAVLGHLRLLMSNSFSPPTTLERYTGRKTFPILECRAQYFWSMKSPWRSDLINALVTLFAGPGVRGPSKEKVISGGRVLRV